jgi:hypothetical protein
MAVEQPRQHDEPVAIDLLVAVEAWCTDGSEAIVLDYDITRGGRCSGSVEDEAPVEQRARL